MRLADVGSVAVTQRPGLIGALLIGRRHGEGHRLRRAKAPRDGRPPARAHRGVLAGAGRARPALRQPGRLGRPHAPRPGDRPARAAHPRPDDRRRGGGGHRQGRPPAGPRLPRRPRPGAPGGDRDRAPRTSSRSGCAGAGTRDFSFAGVKTALLYAVRERPAPPDERERADLAASYQEAVLRPLADRLSRRPSTRASRRWRSAAAWPPTGACASWSGRAPTAHGLRLAVPDRSLCTDNAAMIGAAAQFTEAVPWPRLPGPRRGRDRAARGDRRMRPVRRAAVALAGAGGADRAGDPRRPDHRARRPGAGTGPGAEPLGRARARRSTPPPAWRDTLGATGRPPLPTPGDTGRRDPAAARPARRGAPTRATAPPPRPRSRPSRRPSSRCSRDLGATVTFRYRVLLNAVAVSVPAGRVEALGGAGRGGRRRAGRASSRPPRPAPRRPRRSRRAAPGAPAVAGRRRRAGAHRPDRRRRRRLPPVARRRHRARPSRSSAAPTWSTATPTPRRAPPTRPWRPTAPRWRASCCATRRWPGSRPPRCRGCWPTASWPRSRSGGRVRALARTDRVLAALERAVDPNQDGDPAGPRRRHPAGARGRLRRRRGSTRWRRRSARPTGSARPSSRRPATTAPPSPGPAPSAGRPRRRR